MPWPHNLSVADRLIGSPGPTRLKSWRRFPEAAGTAAAPRPSGTPDAGPCRTDRNLQAIECCFRGRFRMTWISVAAMVVSLAALVRFNELS